MIFTILSDSSAINPSPVITTDPPPDTGPLVYDKLYKDKAETIALLVTQKMEATNIIAIIINFELFILLLKKLTIFSPNPPLNINIIITKKLCLTS